MAKRQPLKAAAGDQWSEPLRTKIQVPFVAWIPFKQSFRITPEWPDDQAACFHDLAESVAKVLQYLEPRYQSVRAEWVDNWKSVPSILLLNNQDYFFPKFHRFLKIECVVEVSPGDIQHSDPVKLTNYGDAVGIFASCLSSSCFDVLLLASLAYPARIHTRFGRIFGAGVPLNDIQPLTGFTADYLYCLGSWPETTWLPISKTVEWDRLVALFKNGIATNPVQRIFACYTRLQQIRFNDAYSMLFYCMQGLEGFYCQGVGDLRRQLTEKIKLFVGESESSRNIIGQLYDLRSRFVHGHYPILRANCDIELSEADRKRDDDISDATALALRILIATLHRCIRNRVTSVSFDWSMNVQVAPED